MKRRRLLLVALTLLLVATFFLPPVYWRVVGWANGEAFYDGRPTSWWEREVETRFSAKYELTFNDGPGIFPLSWEWKASPVWYELLLPKSLRPVVIQGKPPLVNGDVAALPVLLELVRSKEPKVRQLGMWGLGSLGEDGKSALPAVRQACEDSDANVRSAARYARFLIEWNQEGKSEE